jgi:hypothetical protein
MRSTTEPQCTLRPASVSDSHFQWQNQAIMPERRVIGYYGLRNEQQDEVAENCDFTAIDERVISLVDGAASVSYLPSCMSRYWVITSCAALANFDSGL